jgi:hypothetical protein
MCLASTVLRTGEPLILLQPSARGRRSLCLNWIVYSWPSPQEVTPRRLSGSLSSTILSVAHRSEHTGESLLIQCAAALLILVSAAIYSGLAFEAWPLREVQTNWHIQRAYVRRGEKTGCAGLVALQLDRTDISDPFARWALTEHARFDVSQGIGHHGSRVRPVFRLVDLHRKECKGRIVRSRRKPHPKSFGPEFADLLLVPVHSSALRQGNIFVVGGPRIGLRS